MYLTFTVCKYRIYEHRIPYAIDLPDVPDMLVAVPHGRAVETPEVPRVDQGVVGHDHVAVEEDKYEDCDHRSHC